MGLAQTIPILGDQGRPIEEHPRLILGGGARYIRDIGVDTIAIKVHRARRLGDHIRGRGEGDHGIDGSQRARLRGVEDVHLRGLRECMRLWGVGWSHERIPHDNTGII
jgi:hypothetical protein